MSDFIPNSFQVPNKIIDEVMSKVTANAFKCYFVIVRKTTGWNKEWDKISTTQLMELTGIKKKETVYKCIKELEELSLVEMIKEKGKLTQFRLVPKKGTSTEKSDYSKRYPTKDNNNNTKKQSDYDRFIEFLKSKCKYKSKVTKTKDGERLYKEIEDKKSLIKAYIQHQEEKKEFATRITKFMEDYETVHKEVAEQPRFIEKAF